MPKIDTDFSRNVIYKIVCKDLAVIDCYVGHTTSFKHRKAIHKQCCNNEKDLKHNLKVYKIIRENGGWENWQMVLVEEFACENKLQATARERFWYEQLNANLNSQVPNRSVKEYIATYKKENQSKLNQQFDCSCGGKYLYHNKSHHFKTNMHLNFISTNSNNDPDGQTDTED